MRAMLGRFGLSGHHHLVPIVKLSGGQKARVVFAAIALSNAHILLLDEPTNHLDMQVCGVRCRRRSGASPAPPLPGPFSAPRQRRKRARARRPAPPLRACPPLCARSRSTRWQTLWRSLRGA